MKSLILNATRVSNLCNTLRCDKKEKKNEIEKNLQITKSKGFSVFVYPAGHVAFAGGLDEFYLSQFDVFRGHDGKIIESDELCKYANARVEEIIPCSSTVNIVVEI